MARFNENDPVRTFDPMLSMGPHRYVLGYGNPLSYVDPDGRVGFLSDMRQFFDDNSTSYRQAGSNPGAGKAAVIANAAGSVLNEVGAAPFRGLNYLSNIGADYVGRIAPVTFGGVQEQAATDLEGTFHAAEGLANAAAHPLDTRERMSNRFADALSGDNAAAFDSAQFVGALATLPLARAF